LSRVLLQKWNSNSNLIFSCLYLIIKRLWFVLFFLLLKFCRQISGLIFNKKIFFLHLENPLKERALFAFWGRGFSGPRNFMEKLIGERIVKEFALNYFDIIIAIQKKISYIYFLLI